MFDAGSGILHLDIRKGVGRAFVAQQQRVALRVVARAAGALRHLHQPTVCVLAVAGRNALGENRAPGIPAEVGHLGARVGLLVVVGQRHGIELPNRVVALQDHAWVLPGNGRSGLDLGP